MSHSSPGSPAPPQRPLLQQAPVVPLDASGFTAAVVGTILFGLASVICWIGGFTGQWVHIIQTGTGIGVILIAFTAWHRQRKHTPHNDRG